MKKIFLILSSVACMTVGCNQNSLESASLEGPINAPDKDSGVTNDPELPGGPSTNPNVDQKLSFWFGNEDLSDVGDPAFVSIGPFHSIMYSCDGGESWKGYQTTETAFRCGDEVGCQHGSHAPSDVKWGPDGFVAIYGHGDPGVMLISENGKDWDTVFESVEFGKLASGNGAYVFIRKIEPNYSLDGLKTFQTGVDKIPSMSPNHRKAVFIPHGDGAFMSLAESSEDMDLAITYDYGQTFINPETRPLNCGNGGFAYNEDILVLNSRAMCISYDQGLNWIKTDSFGNRSSIYYDVDSKDFVFFNGNKTFKSADALDWNKHDMVVNGQPADGGFFFKVTSYHAASGRFIGFSKADYENARQYYSDDGINWTEVESQNAPVAPHRPQYVAPGFIKDCK